MPEYFFTLYPCKVFSNQLRCDSGMFIEAVPNRSLPPAGRLRESYRDEQGRSQKRTLANLSNMYSGRRPIRTPSDIAGLKMGSQATKIARNTVLAFGGIPTVIAINAPVYVAANESDRRRQFLAA